MILTITNPARKKNGFKDLQKLKIKTKVKKIMDSNDMFITKKGSLTKKERILNEMRRSKQEALELARNNEKGYGIEEVLMQL